jgi:hypothetical protein
MLAIIALILIAIVALAIVGFAAHILFSPWLLLVAAGILLWIKFGPRRSRQVHPTLRPGQRVARCRPPRMRAATVASRTG